jgi:hypothetical protein
MPDQTPAAIIPGTYLPPHPPGRQRRRITVDEAARVYNVQVHSSTLVPQDHLQLDFTGFFERVWVVEAKRGQRKTPILFFYRRIRLLLWDPNRWLWKDHTNILSYTTWKGLSVI